MHGDVGASRWPSWHSEHPSASRRSSGWSAAIPVFPSEVMPRFFLSWGWRTVWLISSTPRTVSYTHLDVYKRQSLWRALKNPVFWAPVLGVVIAIANFHIPGYVEKGLTILGAATEGTALFVTGLIVSAQRFSVSWSVGWAVLAKNVIQPALCFAVLFPLDVYKRQTYAW